MDEYPKRPRFFALRFCRLVTKVCLPNVIGTTACYLLNVIAHTEDAAGYRHPITFFNGQLAPLIGASSVETLVRARKKAVESGWLHYEEGGKGVAGRYWVMIPTRYEHLDDAPTCEIPGEYATDYLPQKSKGKPTANAVVTCREANGKSTANAVDNDSHLIEDFPVPVPKPVPNPATDTIETVATEWAFIFCGSGREMKNPVHVAAQFRELLKAPGMTVAAIAAETRRADRMRTEPIWDFMRRLAPTKNGKHVQTIDQICADLARENGL